MDRKTDWCCQDVIKKTIIEEIKKTIIQNENQKTIPYTRNQVF